MTGLRKPIGEPDPEPVTVKGGLTLPDGRWLFAAPPYWADEYGMKIWGRDFTGGACMVVDLRGWGYLTGYGTALRMPSSQAVASQKAMADFIAEAMNKAIEETSA